MCVRHAILFYAEQIPQIIFGEMAMAIFIIIHNCIR